MKNINEINNIIIVTGPHTPFDDYEIQRKLLSNMAQCFVQLSHKAQTIFQVIDQLISNNINQRFPTPF